MAVRARRDRFGEPITRRATLAPQWGWVLRTCTGPCGQAVLVFEVPAGYLDSPEWGPYRCGDCGGQTRREETP